MKIFILVIILSIYSFVYLKSLLIEQFNNDIRSIKTEQTNLIYDDLCLIYSQNQNHLTINYYNLSKYSFNTFNKIDGELINKELKNKLPNITIFYYPKSNKNFLFMMSSNFGDLEINAYYENEIIKIKRELYTSKFTFLDDNTLIFCGYGKLSKYGYPPNKEIYSEKINYYNIRDCLGLYDSFAIVKEDYMKKEYFLEIRNKDFTLINNSKINLNDKNYDIYLSYIDYNDKNIFLLCYVPNYVMLTSANCAPIKLEQNKIIFGKFINVASNALIFNLSPGLTILGNYTIALSYLYAGYSYIYISILYYSNGELKPGEYFKNKTMELPKKNYNSYNFEAPFLYNYDKKGFVLYYLFGKNTNTSFYKYYFNAACDSFDYTIKELNQKQQLSFDNYLTGGKEEETEFQILQFDNNLKIYKKKELIKPGKTKYKQNQIFEIEANYTIKKNQKIKFTIPNLGYECKVSINYKKNIIKIVDREEFCIKKENSILNDIIEHDLNEIKSEKSVEFKLKFKNPVTNNGLYYIHNGKKFKCKKSENIYVICKPKFKIKDTNEFDIYSELSCKSPIFIGTLKIGDPYIIETFEVPNMDELTKNFNNNYNPKKKIEKFDINMISYYYWFASFNYCSEENKKVCDKYLNNWKIIDQYQILETNDLFFPVYFNELRSEIIKEMTEKEYKEFLNFKSVNVKYIVYKNDNYKKYVISFSGYKPEEYLFRAFLSRKVNYLNNINIEINEFFLEQFESIENFLFSKKFMQEIMDNPDYQIIFIGHSFGGAMATLSAYAFVKKYLKNYELTSINPVLITFGQPRVGNEFFAKDFTKSIPNIYRISHINDYITMFPLRKSMDHFKLPTILQFFKDIYSTIKKINDFFDENKIVKTLINITTVILITVICTCSGLIIECLKDAIIHYLLPKALDKLLEETMSFVKKNVMDVINMIIPHGYCHIGGLYMIDKKRKSFNHCVDFYNQKTKHKLCDNFADFDENYDKMFLFMFSNNRQYFTKKQNIIERCNKMINK